MPETLEPATLSLLLVETDPVATARLLALCDSAAHPHLQLAPLEDTARAEDRLRSEHFDVILLGVDRSSRSDLTDFARLHKAAPNTPIILLTRAGDEDTSLLAVREGAEDYLVDGTFDTRELIRTLRHSIERKRVENRLRQSEEFFRLISENVTDLIAVVDRDGRRLYNSPSYERSLGKTTRLTGTDSFHEIHPEDRSRIQALFRETLATGVGRRTEYRMLLGDGAIRYIESLGNVVLDEHGQPDKIVVVSRDITERRRAMDELEQTLAQLRQAHRELQEAQARLVQSEKIEALSTFAAAIAHEVRNPLQTILLGVDFLKESPGHAASAQPANTQLVLGDLESAARKADAVIQGLLEFTAFRQQEINEHDLSGIVEQSLQAVAAELAQRKLRLSLDLHPSLPHVRVDARKIRHVLIKLILGMGDRLRPGDHLTLRTRYNPALVRGGAPARAREAGSGSASVSIELEHPAPLPDPVGAPDKTQPALIRKEELDLMVVKKVVELYGGMVETGSDVPGSSRIRILFRALSNPEI